MTDPPGPADDQAFFAGLSDALGRGSAAAADVPPQGPEGSDIVPAPSRILVAIDGLDQMPAPAAAAFLESAHRCLGRPGFVAFAGFDRGHLAQGLAETDPALAEARLERIVQLSYDVGVEAIEPGRFAHALLVPGAVSAAAPADPTVATSALDRPWESWEGPLIEALAPFAGGTPRRVKRFVNAYRVARADRRMADATPSAFAGLAAALALGIGPGGSWGASDWRDGFLGSGEAEAAPIHSCLAAAHRALDGTLVPEEARRGMEVARSFTGRG